jgi:hypothetical protein
MWRDYLPNSQIYVIEYQGDEHRDVWHNPSLDIQNVKIILGDSTKEETWKDIPSLDIIVDDGSHYAQDQLSTFLIGFGKLSRRGLYFIEDTHCNFEQKYGATDMLYKWFFDLIIKQQTPQISLGCGDFYKAIPYIQDIAKSIYSYHFYRSVIMVEKA